MTTLVFQRAAARYHPSESLVRGMWDRIISNGQNSGNPAHVNVTVLECVGLCSVNKKRLYNYTEQKWKRYTTITYILWETIGQVFTKALKCFPDIQQHPANDSSTSTNCSRLMSEICPFKFWKLIFQTEDTKLFSQVHLLLRISYLLVCHKGQS